MKAQLEPAPAPDDAREAAPKPSRGPGRPTLSNAELLDKALDIFLEKGFERTSIDAITAAAGMAKRTVYLRYGDKAALFKAALERAIDEWILPVEALRAAECDDFEETLLRVSELIVANIMKPAGLRLLRITNAEAGRMPEIGVYTYNQGTGRTIAYLADLFRRRIPNGQGLADAQDAAQAFLMVITGPATMTVWGLEFDDAAVDRHTRYAVSLFLHGLLAPQPSAGAAADACAATDVAVLEEENRRLRKLLVETMLETAALKEGRAAD
jgi:AcrR family transcriptional regulator